MVCFTVIRFTSDFFAVRYTRVEADRVRPRHVEGLRKILQIRVRAPNKSITANANGKYTERARH